MMKHLNIHVYGRVQGVFFRSETCKQAELLGVTGFVRNEPDGSVFIEAEGKEDVLDQFVQWCHEGPEAAQVDQVEREEGEIRNFSFFEVKSN